MQELLTSPEAATRTAGVLALAACDPKEAAPQLAKLLEDEAPPVRQTVMRVLKDLKDPRVAEAVAARLPTDTFRAADVLKAMGPAAEKAILPYLADKYAGPTRFWVFNVLKDIGTAASLPALEAVQGGDRVHVSGVIQAVRERLPLTADESDPGAGRSQVRQRRPPHPREPPHRRHPAGQGPPRRHRRALGVLAQRPVRRRAASPRSRHWAAGEARKRFRPSSSDWRESIRGCTRW